MKTILLTVILLWSQISFAGDVWISLYNGAEQSFSQDDRNRVVSVLKGFGVDFVVGAAGEIMVPSGIRNPTQDLVAVALPLTRKKNKTE
jgi:hypothetical protein